MDEYRYIGSPWLCFSNLSVVSMLHLNYTHTHQTAPFLTFYEANLSCYENIQIQSIQTHSLGICPLKSFV